MSGFNLAAMALRWLVEHAEETVDLLLTDVVMTGVSGPVLAENLQVLRPEMRVL